MKKSIIIVVVIAAVLLGGFILINKSGSSIQGAANDAKTKAVQASLKAFVAGTMGELAKYDGDVKNTTPFDQNPVIKQSLEMKLSVLKEKYGGDYAYKVFDSSKDASVKATETSRAIYVCIDSKTIKVVDISGTNFDKSSDCDGNPLE